MKLPKCASSMTGYARAEAKLMGDLYRIEAKSLNHRNLEIKCRIPREWGSGMEIQVRRKLQDLLKRGSIEVSIERIGAAAEHPGASKGLNLSKDRIQALKDLTRDLRSVQKSLKMKSDLRISDLYFFTEYLRDLGSGKNEEPSFKDRGDEGEKELWEGLAPFLENLAYKLTLSRKSEGAKIIEMLGTVEGRLKKGLRFFSGRRKSMESELAQKMEDRLRQAVLKFQELQAVDEASFTQRLAQEVAFQMDRSDVSEELSRFEGHLEELHLTLKSADAIGKKLEFLAQELGREVNTLTTKSQDLDISKEAVELKLEIEKIREQAANLE